MEQDKKISFSFSKVIKKPELNKKIEQCNKTKIDYINCVDDKSIKVIGAEKIQNEELLIIPMLGSKSWHDNIVNKITSNIQSDKKREINKEMVETIKQNIVNLPKEPQNTKDLENNLSLDAQAAQEIISDLKTRQIEKKNESLVIDQVSNLSSESHEPTLENYEEIPIEKFGVAMLRGMGWNPDEGIGKNAQVVKSILPTLRPKGIGLGADKIFQHNSSNLTTNDVKLKLEKGSYVKIVAGNLKNNYGIIESFDDDSGRVIIKLSSTNKIVSLNEVLVEPITKNSYENNSRVINTLSYEKYKNEITSSTIKNKELKEHKPGKFIENNGKDNAPPKLRKNRRTSSSSDYDNYNSKKNYHEESRKRIQSKKKSSDSKRHCDSPEFYRQVDKKRHKKEKKRHKKEKYQSHKHKSSKSEKS